jgi:DNA-binding beta-propeller fold protein YncE
MEIKMKTRLVAFLALFMIFGTSRASAQTVTKQVPMEYMSGLLRLVETIPLPVDGKMDHLTVDLKNQHLFITGEEARSFVVVDMRAHKVIAVTKGLTGNPRKPFYDPKTNLIWVNNGDNTVVGIDATTYEVAKNIEMTGGKGATVISSDGKPTDREPDNAAYDYAKGMYYVGIRTKGTKQGTIEVIDTKAGKLVDSIKLGIEEPAGIAIDEAANRLYVADGDVEKNGESNCQVIDTTTRKVIATWEMTGANNAHTAGLDIAHHRLFVGSRLGGRHKGEPGKLGVINTDTGKMVQVLDAPGGADEVFYDAATARIYFVGTTGNMAVYKQLDPDHYQFLGKVPTGAVAKSGIWIPELKRFYLAVPRHIVQTPTKAGNEDNDEDAHLMVLEAQP